MAIDLELNNNNGLIAQFMGYKLKDRNGELAVILNDAGGSEYMRIWGKYHNDWTALMQVVSRIDMHNIDTKIEHFVAQQFQKNYHDVYRCTIGDGYPLEIVQEAETKIKSVYLAVIEFIKQYNEKESLTTLNQL